MLRLSFLLALILRRYYGGWARNSRSNTECFLVVKWKATTEKSLTACETRVEPLQVRVAKDEHVEVEILDFSL